MHLFPPLIEPAFGECQFAYRLTRGARDAVLLHVVSWLAMLNGGLDVGFYCSDVSVVFDRVSVARLFDKSSAVGFHRDLFGL